jgi:hypothetical protein
VVWGVDLKGLQIGERVLGRLAGAIDSGSSTT